MTKHRSFARFLGEGLEGAALTLVVLITWPMSKRRLRNWGSLPQERTRAWPGDDLVLPDHTSYTRAVTIDASASEVWPWLVQFGFGRAGFYSYELLERLVGIPVTNVENIVPEYQSLSIGDEILLHPKAPGIPVAALEPRRHICFGTTGDHEKPDPARSWSMYLEPLSQTSCRLVLRGCIEGLRQPTLGKRLGNLLAEPIDFVMEQRMLRTIGRLARQRGTEGPVVSSKARNQKPAPPL